MKMAMIGLGRMGGNMARRLCRAGIEVVGFNRTLAVAQQIADDEGMVVAHNLADAVSPLDGPRVVWLMLPSGDPTEQHIQDLIPLLDADSIYRIPGMLDCKRVEPF